MKKVLITGATGFLGSWVTRVLASDDYEVTAVAREHSDLYRLQNIRNCQIIRLNENKWCGLIEKIEPNILLSFDWSGVSGLERNSEAQSNNIRRVLGLAEQAISSDVELFFTFGSQAEVGPMSLLISESAELQPTTEYGRTKAKLLTDLSTIFYNSNTKFIWGRVFSTYGPLDSPNWFIPQMITALLNSDEFDMTLGEQNWNYLHAYDFALAVNRIIDCKDIKGIVNIANTEQIKLIDLARTVQSSIATTGQINIGAVAYREDQVMNLIPDVSVLTKIGWSPQVQIEMGVSELINWMSGNISTTTTPIICKLDIPRYEK